MCLCLKMDDVQGFLGTLEQKFPNSRVLGICANADSIMGPYNRQYHHDYPDTKNANIDMTDLFVNEEQMLRGIINKTDKRI